MKKSTLFLKENFRENYSREDNYRINGRKLATLLDMYAKEPEDACVSLFDMLNDKKREVDAMTIEKEVMNQLIESQSEIIMQQTTDLGNILTSRSTARFLAVIFSISTILLAVYALSLLGFI